MHLMAMRRRKTLVTCHRCHERRSGYHALPEMIAGDQGAGETAHRLNRRRIAPAPAAAGRATMLRAPERAWLTVTAWLTAAQTALPALFPPQPPFVQHVPSRSASLPRSSNERTT
jgi:hypothetical protein